MTIKKTNAKSDLKRDIQFEKVNVSTHVQTRGDVRSPSRV